MLHNGMKYILIEFDNRKVVAEVIAHDPNDDDQSYQYHLHDKDEVCWIPNDELCELDEPEYLAGYVAKIWDDYKMKKNWAELSENEG